MSAYRRPVPPAAPQPAPAPDADALWRMVLGLEERVRALEAARVRDLEARAAKPARRRPSAPAAPASLGEHEAAERGAILAALEACKWNRVAAAERLGMPRRTFYRRLKDYGIQ